MEKLQKCIFFCIKVKVQKPVAPKTLDVTQTAGFHEAMEDIKHGRVYHADSVDEMFKQILG